jgi:hypothetical protein
MDRELADLIQWATVLICSTIFVACGAILSAVLTISAAQGINTTTGSIGLLLIGGSGAVGMIFSTFGYPNRSIR